MNDFDRNAVMYYRFWKNLWNSLDDAGGRIPGFTARAEVVTERKVSKYGSKRVCNPRLPSRGKRGLQIPLEREEVFVQTLSKELNYV